MSRAVAAPSPFSANTLRAAVSSFVRLAALRSWRRPAPPFTASTSSLIAAAPPPLPGRSFPDHQHDLPELAPCLEALIGVGYPVERERLGHRDAHLAPLDQRKNVVFHTARGERLLLERAGAQHRAHDPGALAHQKAQVELALRARADADHRDPAEGVQRLQVVTQIGGTDELE